MAFETIHEPSRLRSLHGGGILGDWINGIRGGTIPCSNFEVSGPLTEMILLGTLAIRTGKSVEDDGTGKPAA